MNLDVYIGERVRLIRKQRGMYHEEVAEALGVTRTSVVNFEKGRQRISVEKLLKLCALFECEVMDVLPTSDNHTPKLNPFRDHTNEVRTKRINAILNRIDLLKQELIALK